MTTIQFTLGDRMRKAREHAGLSQRQLALRLGIGKNTVTRYELGHTHPRMDTVVRWAFETSVDLDWLCGDEVAA